MIERRYRIRPQRRWHAIAGLSMGGYGAMYLASQLPG
jgi:S-formylglutathione hydrolase FrmB